MTSFYKHNLIIEKYSNEIVSAIENNKTVLIKGPTGCGKSTYVPLLLDYENKKIAIIEPRRIAVTSLYNTLCTIMGDKIGYKMRFNKRVSEKTNVIIYTDGAFINDARHKKFDYIILDEVHERSIRTDVILSLLKLGNSKNILMSATVDTNKIQRYCDANIVEIEGNSFPVKIIYSNEPISDYILESYTIIKGIVIEDKIKRENDKKKVNKIEHRTIEDDVDDFLDIKKEESESTKEIEECEESFKTDNCDILVFLTGEEDINELYKLLKKILNIKVFKIHSSLSDSDQGKIFEDSSLRKVILSTNICETSLTIPGIKYVIDCGVAKTKIFDKIDYMGILAISRESAKQRLGRCNRTGPGVCYRLYPEEIYKKMSDHISEIKRTDLSNAILQLTDFEINIFDCQLLDYPSQTNILSALQFLLRKKLVFINFSHENKTYKLEFDSLTEIKKRKSVSVSEEKINLLLKNIFSLKANLQITNYGRIINSLPFDVNLGCFYQECLANNLGYYGSILTSLMSLQNYNFVKNINKDKSDIEYLIETFEEYLKAENKYLFCKEKNISQKFFEKANNIFLKLKKKKGKNEEIKQLEKVFSSSFEYNKSIKNKDGSYTHLESDRKVFVHPSSGFFKRNERYIVFVDVLCTTKEYVRIVGKFYN